MLLKGDAKYTTRSKSQCSDKRPDIGKEMILIMNTG